jgi:serine/threonine-protein kinase RsbT
MHRRFPSSQLPHGEVRGVASRLERCLGEYLSPITAQSVLVSVCRKLGVQSTALDTLQENVLITVLEQALTLYLTGPEKQKAIASVRGALKARSQAPEQAAAVVIGLGKEADVTLARATALRVALGAGLVKPDAVKVSTVVSELSRNILQYAGSGHMELKAVHAPRAGVEIVATDRGPGIANVQEILDGKYRSRTGMGVGLIGSRRLMDRFEVVSERGKGTTITAAKYV